MTTIEEKYYADNPLDVSGSLLKEAFSEKVEQIIAQRDKAFENCFEWCSGIGEMGFELLRYGLCEELVLSDIHPEPIANALQISKRDGITNKIAFYVSDNFKDIPDYHTFDLIIGNPPTYCNIQSQHPTGGQFHKDRRALDKGWDIHREFFRTVGNYLTHKGVILFHAIEPFKQEIFIDSHIPYDVRPHMPIVDFERMISANGFQIFGCNAIASLHPEVRSFLIEVRRK